jgi:hypothetical protein
VIIQLQMCHCNLALKLPLSTAHGAEGCRCLRIDPLQYAVKMISMVAGTPDEWAIVTRELAVRAATIKCHPAYATRLILRIPRPRRYRMPLKNLDLHCATWYAKSKVPITLKNIYKEKAKMFNAISDRLIYNFY